MIETILQKFVSKFVDLEQLKIRVDSHTNNDDMNVLSFWPLAILNATVAVHIDDYDKSKIAFIKVVNSRNVIISKLTINATQKHLNLIKSRDDWV